MSALDTQALGMVPMVIEQSGRGERAYDIYSAPVARPHRFPGRPGQRPERQPGGGAAAVPGKRKPRQGHLRSTSTRRVVASAPACRSTTRCSSSSRTCPPCASAWPPAWVPSCWRRCQGQAHVAAQQQDHDPPAHGRRPGPGHGHGDPRPRDPEDPRAAEPHPGERTGQPSKRSRPTPTATTT